MGRVSPLPRGGNPYELSLTDSSSFSSSGPVEQEVFDGNSATAYILEPRTPTVVLSGRIMKIAALQVLTTLLFLCIFAFAGRSILHSPQRQQITQVDPPNASTSSLQQPDPPHSTTSEPQLSELSSEEVIQEGPVQQDASIPSGSPAPSKDDFVKAKQTQIDDVASEPTELDPDPTPAGLEDLESRTSQQHEASGLSFSPQDGTTLVKQVTDLPNASLGDKQSKLVDMGSRRRFQLNYDSLERGEDPKTAQTKAAEDSGDLESENVELRREKLTDLKTGAAKGRSDAGTSKLEATPNVSPETRPISLNLEAVEAPRPKSFSAEENSKQWAVDIERAKAIASLSEKNDIISLKELDNNEEDREAHTKLAAIIAEQAVEGKQLFSRVQQTKILEAIGILRHYNDGPDDKTFKLKAFNLCGGGEGPGLSGKFKWKRVLGVGAMAVTFEVEPVDESLVASVSGQPLAMKVHVQFNPEDATEEELFGEFELLDHCVNQEAGILEKIRARGESPVQTVNRSGIVSPAFEGKLESDTADAGQTDLVTFHKKVLFSPLMAADFMTIVRRQKGKPPVPMDVKVNILKRFLLGLGHLHKAGQLNNDVKIDNILIDHNGKAFISDFGAAAGIGETRRLWSQANVAPEQLREINDGGPMTGTEKGESWGAAMTAFFTFSNPFDWKSLDTYLPLLLSESPEMLREDFDFTKYPSPAFALRIMGVPEEWVCIVTSLMQPDPSARPTVRQVLQAFPDIMR